MKFKGKCSQGRKRCPALTLNNLRVRNNILAVWLYSVMDYDLFTGFLLEHQYLKTGIKNPSSDTEHSVGVGFYCR